MDITYLGHSSFLIKTREAKIVTDPFDAKMVGLPYPKVTANIVTTSHQHGDHNNAKAIGGEPHVFDWPGEFEKNSVRIFGFQSYHDTKKGAERGENIVFKFDMEGMSVVHLGDLGYVPDEKLVEDIGNVDVLMLPVGGFFTMGSTEAAETVKKLDPFIVIPMHYNTPGMNPEIAEKLEPVTTFLQKMGAEETQPVDKFSVKKEDLVEDTTKVVVMSITS